MLRHVVPRARATPLRQHCPPLYPLSCLPHSQAAVLQYKYPWAKTSVDILVRAAVDRRQNFSEAQQRVVQEWNAMCKGEVS